MSVAKLARLAIAAALAGVSTLPAQQKAPPAYPEPDALTPFRNPTDVYAPPDELFRHLRVMQNLAGRSGAKVRFDETGREVLDDAVWQAARAQAEQIGIDAGMLAQMMRLHRDGVQRNTAFYAAFYVAEPGNVLDLIAHIPGEPNRRTREEAMARAVPFVRAHLGRRFGDLPRDQQDALRSSMPQPGSPAAKAQGITRLPIDSDHLYVLRLKPFFQLLDLDDALDQAQGLWFLKEVFRIRRDLAELWLEPALPRLMELLQSTAPQVRDEALQIFRLIGPKDLPEPPSDAEQLRSWAERAAKHMFPPIRSLNDAIVQLYPSTERDEIAAAGIAALENSAIGDPFRGQTDDGSWFRGFRVIRVPEALRALAIPADSVITTVNGSAVGSAQELLELVRQQVKGARPRRVFVEYVRNGKAHAVEYRIM